MTLAELVAVLLAACIAVPVFRRFGFGSVLGYLAAGIALGPYGLGLVDDFNLELLALLRADALR